MASRAPAGTNPAAPHHTGTSRRLSTPRSASDSDHILGACQFAHGGDIVTRVRCRGSDREDYGMSHSCRAKTCDELSANFGRTESGDLACRCVTDCTRGFLTLALLP